MLSLFSTSPRVSYVRYTTGIVVRCLFFSSFIFFFGLLFFFWGGGSIFVSPPFFPCFRLFSYIDYNISCFLLFVLLFFPLFFFLFLMCFSFFLYPLFCFVYFFCCFGRRPRSRRLPPGPKPATSVGRCWSAARS